MECSMEMKMQAVDKMLAVRKQLITMQDKVGMWNQVDDRTPLLIYNTEDFFVKMGSEQKKDWRALTQNSYKCKI